MSRFTERLKHIGKKNLLSLTDILKFGKYKNYTLEDVIVSDPRYMMWACDNNIVELDNHAYLLLQEKYQEYENNRGDFNDTY